MKAPSARRCRQVLLLLAIGALPAAFAFNLLDSRWANGSTTFYVGMDGKSPSGINWATAFENAMKTWNSKTSFKFVANPDYLNPCNGYSSSSGSFPSGSGDLKNGADFRSNVCGNSFGSGVLAITLTAGQDGQFGFQYMQEADIIFNTAYTWDIYDGPRQSKTDFGRVALHELGHALGLGHESTATSIMAPSISNLYQLQPDDIAGAQALYGPQTLCSITPLPLKGAINGSLGLPDCRVKELFGLGSDDSFVDVYRFSLSASTRIVADMRSSLMDSVLVLTDSKLNELDIFDDYQGGCNAHMDKTLAAGDYLLLANSYATAGKCGSNQGGYSLSINDSAQPTLGETHTTSGATVAATLITGGASADGGLTYKTSFTAKDSIDVDARILPAPSQVGQKGKIYVLIQLSNGSRFSMNSAGAYVPFKGNNLSQMASYRSGPLAAQEQISVAQKVRAEGTSLAGLDFVIYVGYALDSKPADIQYGSEPISFSIAH